MKALVNAGGKGTRMSCQGVEKPMLDIGGEPVIARVVEAMEASSNVDEVVVSVSPHTSRTAEYLNDRGIRTVMTSGEDFMMDMHVALERMKGQYVIVCPSDLPLLSAPIVDEVVEAFEGTGGESILALVDESIVLSAGLNPSYSLTLDGRRWTLSGLSIVDRVGILSGRYLKEHYHLTQHIELAVNVNNDWELELARNMIRQGFRG